MLAKLTSPYPAPRPDRGALLSALFMGGFVTLFLLYFRPFGLASGPYEGAPEKVAFFGLLTFIAFLVLEVLLPLMVPGWFKDKDWKVWHRIVYYLVLIWMIASLNGLYINYVQSLSFSWRNYGEIMSQTLMLGVFYLKEAAVMEKSSRLRSAEQAMHAPADVPTDAGDVFLAAEAFGNYVKVYYADGESWRQEVQRLTLSSLVNDLGAEGVIRCHRSFAVAPGQVRHISGNAQGLQLLVGKGELMVPVSRTYLKVVREALG